MAIVKGIEAGAILWKYKKPATTWVWDRERHQNVRQEVLRCYVIKLVTRRARTIGSSIDKSIYPFFRKLNIKLDPIRDYGINSISRYVAVGTETVHVTEERYNEMEIDEVAKRFYQQILNQDLKSLLDKRDTQFHNPKEIVLDLKSISGDDESEVMEWPQEPHLRIHSERLNRGLYERI